MPEVRKRNRSARHAETVRQELERVRQEKEASLENLSAQFFAAMLEALTKLAVDCETMVRTETCPMTEQVKWVVEIEGMEHTINGERVNSRHTRTVSLCEDDGPFGPFWTLEIDDSENIDRAGFWSLFYVRWVADYDEFKLCIEYRHNTCIREVRNEGSTPRRWTENVNDGMSYQGVSTRLFDDLLQLLGKLATMRVFERLSQ